MKKEHILNTNQEFLDELAKYKVKCKYCGHPMHLVNTTRCICSHCKRYIFKNKTEEFKYRFKEFINKKGE